MQKEILTMSNHYCALALDADVGYWSEFSLLDESSKSEHSSFCPELQYSLVMNIHWISKGQIVRLKDFICYSDRKSTKFRISLVKRQSFFFQNNPKDLDPSYQTDLDLWDC